MPRRLVGWRGTITLAESGVVGELGTTGERWEGWGVGEGREGEDLLVSSCNYFI